MSTSAALEISAGSESATSWAIGKLRVWCAASGSTTGGGLLFGVHPTSTTTAAVQPASLRTGRRLLDALRRCLGRVVPGDIPDQSRHKEEGDGGPVDLGVRAPSGQPDVDERDRAAEPQE